MRFILLVRYIICKSSCFVWSFRSSQVPHRIHVSLTEQIFNVLLNWSYKGMYRKQWTSMQSAANMLKCQRLTILVYMRHKHDCLTCIVDKVIFKQE